jgi:hypothetical protein
MEIAHLCGAMILDGRIPVAIFVGKSSFPPQKLDWTVFHEPVF